MCGRFTLRWPMAKVVAEMGAELGLDIRPRYNVAPTK
jgi:hypothetical protein